jgi:hypothetical protein
MRYSIEIIDLLRGTTLAGSSTDARILSISTDSKLIRDLVIRVDGVGTWEALEEADHSWLIYLAPAHGISVSALRDCVTQRIAQVAAQTR